VWHDSSVCVTRRIYTCDMTHPYVWHDVSICVTGVAHPFPILERFVGEHGVHLRDGTLVVQPNTQVYCFFFLFHKKNTCERVVSNIWTSRVTYMTESCYTYEWVMSHIWMSHVKHVNESCSTTRHTHKCTHTHIHTAWRSTWYEVAMISRLLKIVGLCCRISSLL